MKRKTLLSTVSEYKTNLFVFKVLILCALLILSNKNPVLARVESKIEKSERIISFSGFEWQVKSSLNSKSGTLGPGNNYFSDSKKNVWVDDNGWLHLKITRWNDKWYCAEVTLMQPLVYKRYIFQVTGQIDQFHPNVVGGLFTYLDGTDESEEIDIEFSKWGDKNKMSNAQYAIQPSEIKANKNSFKLELTGDATTHIIDWKPGKIDFISYHGHNTTTPDSAMIINKWSYSGKDVPVNPNGKIHINLWLFKRKLIDPADHPEAELIIRSFQAF